MALTVKNFELPDGTVLDSAYLRIQSIKSENRDYEYFEVADESDADIAQVLQWKTVIESEATVFVWADSMARQNRAYVLNWFKFSFKYDLSEYSNIYEQAYQKLKQIYPEGEDE